MTNGTRQPIELMSDDLLRKLVSHGIYPFMADMQAGQLSEVVYIYMTDEDDKYYGTSCKSEETLRYITSRLG